MTETFPSSSITTRPEHDRNTALSMRRGALGQCPNCAARSLFDGYLKISDSCTECGEDFHHQRADDGPAYITILIVSHLLTPILFAVFLAWRPSVTAMLIGFLAAAVVLSLALLPLIKGSFVGLQWARRMHGFGNGEHEL